MTITESAPTPRAETDAQNRHNQQMAVLLKTSDLTRRIHWWVRLVGVVWLTTIAVGALVAVGFGILAITAVTDVSKDQNGGYANRGECMASLTTAAQCNAWFNTP